LENSFGAEIAWELLTYKLGAANMHEDIYRVFKNIPDDDWIEILCRTPQHPVINGVRFPGFPDPQLQIKMVGSANEHGLREVAALYREAHVYARKIGFTFTKDSRALDFGCGFGRILRFFMKDIAPGNLVGTDVDPSFIKICNGLFSGVRFDVNAPYPPLDHPDASFDFIYAYSVFTHLSEQAHLQWLKELRRIARPEAMIFLTLRQREYLRRCHEWRSKADVSEYQQYQARSFGELDAMLSRYVLGEFIYVSSHGTHGARTRDFYGDTVLPPKYIEKHWSEHFTVVDMVDDTKRMAQAFIVLQPR
jgi:SAM-dependent methyltransferase